MNLALTISGAANRYHTEEADTLLFGFKFDLCERMHSDGWACKLMIAMVSIKNMLEFYLNKSLKSSVRKYTLSRQTKFILHY